MRTLPALLILTAVASCGGGVAAAADRPAYQAGPLADLECVPNLDGRIDSREMRAVVGVPAAWLAPAAGVSRAIDVAGAVGADNNRVWNWGATYADDHVARLTASALAGRWYEPSFRGGQFAAPFDLGGTLEAVYSQDDSALWLHGLASAKSDPAEGRTLLVYDQPVALYRFPLAQGAAWSVTGTVRNGFLRGLPYAARDTYDVQVDGAGRLVLPDFEFTQALRVRTRITIEPAVGNAVTRRQVSFLFECFGEVARATSANGETADDFTTAAEVRRLGL